MAIPEFAWHSPRAIIRYIMDACIRMGCEEAAADVYCRSYILRDDLSNRYYIKIETHDDRKYIHYFDNDEAIIEADLVRIADEYISAMYRKKSESQEATSEPAHSIYVRLSKAIWKAFDEQEIDSDQLTIDISNDYEIRRIKLQIFDTKAGCIYPFFIDQYAPGFDVDLAATAVAKECLKKLNKNKEDNKMAQYNINRGVLYATMDEAIPMPKSQEEIDRENKLIELERIMKDKIKAAKDEYALAVKQMQEEEKAQSLVRRENEAATKWRVRYQACVDAGFTEEQAWKMMMQDIQA